MLNILKMDWFRMIKMKSTWILWIAMAAMLLFSTVMMSEEFLNPAQIAANQEAIEEYEQSSGAPNIGMTVTIPTKPGEQATVYDLFFANVQGKAIALFLVIFAVLFATADIRSGYIKNIGGQIGNRAFLIFSKTVILFAFTALTFFIALLVQAVSNLISFRYLEWGDFQELAVYFGTQVMLHFAFALIVIGLSIVISNNVISMALAICLCMNLTMLLYGAINSLTEKLIGESVNVIPYTVTGQISGIQMQLTGEEIGRAVIVSFVYGVVAAFVGSLVFKKRDIR